MQRRSLIKNLGLLVGGLSVPSASKLALVAPNRVLRIAHLTDIHIQPHLWAAKGLEKCLHHLQNLPVKPDLIINTGDSVMGAHGISKSKSDREWELYHKVLKNENSIPVTTCIGNHDIWNAADTAGGFEDGKKRALEEKQMLMPYYSFDKNGWHIIVLDSVQAKPDGSGYAAQLDEMQMDWLKKDLKNTPSNTPVMIASHIPILSACVFLDGDNVKDGNWAVPGGWMHTDSAQLTQLFHHHKNVKLAASGHIHLLDKVDYNGVSYCCNGAVSGNYWMGKYRQTKPGYAIIDLFDDGSFENTYVSYR